MAYLLDTTTLSFILNGNRAVEQKFRAAIKTDRVYASVVSEGELLAGAIRTGRERRAELLTEIPMLLSDLGDVLQVTRKVAASYAWIRGYLLSIGQMISMNDCWIAAVALSENLILAASDADFRRVPGLVLEDWLEP
jgi:predicted nucleic acid-binding protein